MNIGNDSSLSTVTTIESIYSNFNATVEVYDETSSSTILTIIILSFLCLSGWIFMSYALFSRSEAYRRKPDDQYGVSHHINDPEGSNQTDFMMDLD